MQHFLHRDGQSLPQTQEQLQDLAATGQLSKDDQIYLSDRSQWLVASQVDFLEASWPGAALPPPPPPPPPPPSRAAMAPPPAARAQRPPSGPNTASPAQPAQAPGPRAGAAANAANMTAADLEQFVKRVIDMYKQHWRVLMVTCAILLAPMALVKSAIYGVMMMPISVSGAVVEGAADSAQSDAKEYQEELQKALTTAGGDQAKIAKAQKKYAESIAKLGVVAGGAMVTGILAVLIGAIANFFAFFLFHGLAVPVTKGAVTLCVVDLNTGGPGNWQLAWAGLLKRAVPVGITAIMAAVIYAVGTLMFVLPGIIAAFLFSFAIPVALLENMSGIDALKRSADLVLADWIRVLVVTVVFNVATGIARLIANIFVSPAHHFFGSLLPDLISIALLPVPILAMVLIYFDLRAKLDGIQPRDVRGTLAS